MSNLYRCFGVVASAPKDSSGSVAIIFAICLPVLVCIAGLSIDYGMASLTREKMQQAADAGALAGAKALSLSDAKRENLSAIVKSVVEAYVGSDFANDRRPKFSGHHNPE